MHLNWYFPFPVPRSPVWHRHLGLVERASWWNEHLGGMGILVEWASWWNGHLGGMGILVEWASCPFLLFSDGLSQHWLPRK
ncbi:hypothetical protein BJP36_29635 [Moorena producens JHB]|uniref:Uncharacterized protein n=1 Tax=Moorena producens (strain JHB) TaxID=1454205 RepID=A0A1D9G7S7_MOOP1|nr:hypothetical protein [Moorena producens]AOY83460.2 hypothetical protein BJP36_29635 [Moorena producens JHB]